MSSQPITLIEDESIRLHRTPEAAVIIGDVSPGTMAGWRVHGKGPKYVVLNGNIYYRHCDLVSWINAGITDPADPRRKLARKGGPGRPKISAKKRAARK